MEAAPASGKQREEGDYRNHDTSGPVCRRGRPARPGQVVDTGQTRSKGERSDIPDVYGLNRPVGPAGCEHAPAALHSPEPPLQAADVLAWSEDDTGLTGYTAGEGYRDRSERTASKATLLTLRSHRHVRCVPECDQNSNSDQGIEIGNGWLIVIDPVSDGDQAPAKM